MANLLYFLADRIPQDLRSLVIKYIQNEGYSYKLCFYSETKEEIIKKIKWSDVILFAPGRFLDNEILCEAQHIKLMQLWSSGFDKFNIDGASKYNIPVANNGGSNAISVAEHTILLLLATSRKIVEGHQRVVNGMWPGNSHGLDMVMLHEKKLGIIGLGNIGREVAKRAKSFGMEILYVDPLEPSQDLINTLQLKKCNMDELMQTSDFITLHMHLNKETKGIIGKSEIDLMKKNSIIINVSRSQLIDIDYLYKKLAKKEILGAGFDVYEFEPTTGFEHYLNLPNVVCTPHTAGSTIDIYKKALSNCMKNIRLSLKGIEPNWIVNSK
ncbi:Lactate dehydrogenase-like protein [Prochlorococcus marinus str. MIT 9215]|uniref:Lactate dehydrogenase-like protein n=1 Tax=Prochlorococcus marinus (strain MIT 9215) TaxID=93060 RepID=A8G646_PROM2|nr:NAD(P)-dependent oxidoreductase [Prochlorococcus marinus]ABV51077.1 Lactate dehydrogenase-like protein [Prochlorococcus marinus str. MIT 9215]